MHWVVLPLHGSIAIVVVPRPILASCHGQYSVRLLDESCTFAPDVTIGILIPTTHQPSINEVHAAGGTVPAGSHHSLQYACQYSVRDPSARPVAPPHPSPSGPSPHSYRLPERQISPSDPTNTPAPLSFYNLLPPIPVFPFHSPTSPLSSNPSTGSLSGTGTLHTSPSLPSCSPPTAKSHSPPTG